VRTDPGTEQDRNQKPTEAAERLGARALTPGVRPVTVNDRSSVMTSVGVSTPVRHPSEERR
jgi:hypothetical protein